MSVSEAQKHNLSFVYLVTSIDPACKVCVRTMRCPAQVWSNLKKMFRKEREAAVDAKLCQLQAPSLVKGEKTFEYSNRLSGLVIEIKCAGHAESELEQERAL